MIGTLLLIISGCLLVFSGCNLLAKMHWDKARRHFQAGRYRSGERELELGNRWAPWIRAKR